MLGAMVTLPLATSPTPCGRGGAPFAALPAATFTRLWRVIVPAALAANGGVDAASDLVATGTCVRPVRRCPQPFLAALPAGSLVAVAGHLARPTAVFDGNSSCCSAHPFT